MKQRRKEANHNALPLPVVLQVLASSSWLEDAEDLSVVQNRGKAAGHNASRARRDEDEGMKLTKSQQGNLLMIGVLLIGFGAGFTIASGLCP